MELYEIKNIIWDELMLLPDYETRKRENITARQFYYKFAKLLTKKSLYEIGREVNRDHATVLRGLKMFDDYFNTESEYRTIFNNIHKILTNQKSRFQNNVNCYRTLRESGFSRIQIKKQVQCSIDNKIVERMALFNV